MVAFKRVTNVGFQNFESGSFVAGFIYKRNPDSTNCIDDFFEGTEVDVDVMIYRNAEVLFDSTNQAVWILLVKVGVDAPATS